MSSIPTSTTVWLRLGMPPDEITVGHQNGPGLRLIFWVQGCALRCTRQCLNPQYLSQSGGYLVEPAIFAQKLLRLACDFNEVEGVTVLGGEPFEQAGALVHTLAPVKESGLSVMVYSGFTLEALEAQTEPAVHRLLRLCDLLVDGPFLPAEFDETLIWRGSRNQRVLPLSGRYSETELTLSQARQARGVALRHQPTGEVAVSGAQNLQLSGQLRRLVKC